MDKTEQTAILAIALMAAFADGGKDDLERAEIRRVAESVAGDDINLAAVYQDVLLKRTTLAAAAAALSDQGLRQLAYELAVGVCDADDQRNAAEQAFLVSLADALGLAEPARAVAPAAAEALALAPLDEGSAGVPAAAPKVPVDQGASAPAGVDSQALERTILNHAILNGALELLPQSMASMAIIPLQMKMVYRIGQAHGYELDRGHIKDFLATLGVGLTGQYLEEVGRKIIGGIFGKAAGSLVGALSRGATGVAFSFATTYALGHVAMRYYAGGRTMSTAMLKDAYAEATRQASGLHAQYRGQIEQQARDVNVSDIVKMVRSH